MWKDLNHLLILKSLLFIGGWRKRWPRSEMDLQHSLLLSMTSPITTRKHEIAILVETLSKLAMSGCLNR